MKIPILIPLCAILAGGCSNQWVRLPHYPRHPLDLDAESACQIVASRTRGIETLHAEDVASRIETPSASGSCHLILFVTREGSARIKGYARLFGKTVFDAVATPEQVQVYVPSRGTVTTYRRRAEEPELSWAFGAFVHVLLANVPEESDVYSLARAVDSDWLIIAVTRGGKVRERLLVDRQCLLVRERTILRDDGTPGCTVTYNRYDLVSDFWWPRQWEIEVPERGISSRLEFDPELLGFNRTFSPSVFALAFPEDVERVDGNALPSGSAGRSDGSAALDRGALEPGAIP